MKIKTKDWEISVILLKMYLDCAMMQKIRLTFSRNSLVKEKYLHSNVK